MGDAVSKVTQTLGISADPDAGSGAFGTGMNLQARAVEELDKIDIPDIEKQRLLLEIPKLVGLLETEQLDSSALEEIDMDPALRDNILSAISSEKEYAEQGITDEDRARMNALRRQTQADEKARQNLIMQNMAERGSGGSGSELAARLASSQASADRAQQEAMNLAAQASQNRRQAAQNVASMSGNLDAQDFARAAQKASAADEIARFNAMNRQNVQAQNLAAQQSVADQATALRNQQQMANKGLYQQQFQNQLQKATGMGNQLQNQAQGQMALANQQANAAQMQAAGNREIFNQLNFEMPKSIMGMAGGGMMSDERVKENIKEADSDKIQEMLDKLTPMEYDYKEEVGGMKDNAGIMAQDLEKSEMGMNLVEESPEGVKMIDRDKTMSTTLAALADLQKRLKELEKNKFADGGSPASYTEDEERVDELLDEGNLMINEEAQDDLMEFLRGNKEAGEMEGRIIEGDSFSGDLLPDRINSGELVANVGQQHRMKDKLMDSEAKARGFNKLLDMLGKK